MQKKLSAGDKQPCNFFPQHFPAGLGFTEVARVHCNGIVDESNFFDKTEEVVLCYIHSLCLSRARIFSTRKTVRSGLKEPPDTLDRERIPWILTNVFVLERGKKT